MQPPTPPTDPTTAVEIWSTVGTWFGVIATAVAVGVALWVSHRDWRRTDAEQRDAAMAQARQVLLSMHGLGGIRITNHSALPITNLEVERVVRIGHSEWTAQIDRMASGEGFAREVLAAGDRHSVAVMFVDSDGRRADWDLDELIGEWRVTFSFTDATGRRWRKVGNAEPQRLLSDPR